MIRVPSHWPAHSLFAGQKKDGKTVNGLAQSLFQPPILDGARSLEGGWYASGLVGAKLNETRRVPSSVILQTRFSTDYSASKALRKSFHLGFCPKMSEIWTILCLFSPLFRRSSGVVDWCLCRHLESTFQWSGERQPYVGVTASCQSDYTVNPGYEPVLKCVQVARHGEFYLCWLAACGNVRLKY